MSLSVRSSAKNERREEEEKKTSRHNTLFERQIAMYKYSRVQPWNEIHCFEIVQWKTWETERGSKSTATKYFVVVFFVFKISMSSRRFVSFFFALYDVLALHHVIDGVLIVIVPTKSDRQNGWEQATYESKMNPKWEREREREGERNKAKTHAKWIKSMDFSNERGKEEGILQWEWKPNEQDLAVKFWCAFLSDE